MQIRPVHIALSPFLIRALVLRLLPFFIRHDNNKATRVDGLRGCRASSFINDYARRVARRSSQQFVPHEKNTLCATADSRYTYRTRVRPVPAGIVRVFLFFSWLVAFFYSVLSRREIEQDRSARSLMSSFSLSLVVFFCFVFCRAIQ